MAVPYGKYQLLKKIGSGGMGQVFLARHAGEQGFEKLVVIKRILPHLAEDEDFLTMFFDEARIAARLNHPNLVQIFDLGEANRAQYLAMEYVQGEDLRKLDRFARAQGALIPMGPALRIIADAAAGLDYAHKARDAQGQPLGLVHRDVSPQNILVGFDGAVKLIDFGVAKAAGRVQHTGTGILKGKYPYMSPEQAEGRELDARSDIFALGVVLWEILTGKRLFKGESDLATMRLVVDCQVPPPSKLNPKLPQGLDTVVMQALARLPETRYRDASALRLQIEEFLLAHRVPASSAHLTAYLNGLYASRIAHEADPATLDEFHDGLDPDVDHTPSQSTPGSRAQWRNRAPSGAPAPVARPPSRSTPAAKA
ncbi:MAG: serine/threonine protein kinase, partial [Myxococcota bacterium]|nr:serine/threonine protein kinase [Myxococcota bacterium]